MKHIVALVGVALVGLLAHAPGADAAEPYDSQIATVLVAPTDPTLVEVLDPAADPHSGLVTAAEVKAIARLTPEEVVSVRGGYVRAYSDGHRVVRALGADLGAVGAVQSRLDAGLDVGGTPLTVGGATGFRVEEGVRPDGRAVAAVGFSVGPRIFAVAVTGDDPDHALLYAHMNAIAAAAVALPADAADGAAPVTATSTGRATTALAPTVAPATGLAARWSEVVHDERIDLFLGGAAILLALVLLNRAVNASRHRRVRTTMSQRGSSAARPGPAAWAPNAAAWPTLGNDRWPSSDEAAFPTLATPLATATPALAARSADLPIEAYSGQRDIGWGDEPDESLAPASPSAVAGPTPEPLPPLPSRSKTPKAVPPTAALLPTTGPTAAAPVVPAVPVAAPPSVPDPTPPSAADPAPWTVSASLPDDEQYSFPGAETWPGDPVGDGRA